MNISLTPELEKLIQDKVASGMYDSASEVIREAMRLLQEQDKIRELRLEELRQEIAIGIQQADRGEFSTLSIEDLKQKGRQRLAQRKM